jgi:hypothetical protein
MPFIGLEFATGEKPCWNTGEREQKQSKKSYPLLVVKETGCGEFNTFDDIEKVVDNKQTYKAFYTENNQASVANEKFWNEFFVEATDMVSLVLVRRIIIDKNDDVCFKINPNDIEALEKQIETLKSDLNGIFIAVVSVTALMLLIAFIFYVFKDKTFKHFDFKTRSSSKVLVVLGIVVSILVIAGGIVYYVR